MSEIQARLPINGTPVGGALTPFKPSAPAKTDSVSSPATNTDRVTLEAGDQAPLKPNSKPLPATLKLIQDSPHSLSEKIRNTVTPPPAWGSTSQVQGTLRDLHDVQGNRDGLWDNETKPAGSVGGFVKQQPLPSKAQNWASGLGDLDAQIQALQTFRTEKEAAWGLPVTQLDLAQLKDGKLFAAQKAIALVRLGRTPAELTEGFVSAKGQVNGVKIADRELFWQRFHPQGEPTGKVIVMLPGFLQTGRNFYEQADALSKAGHDVLIMDQQWGGQTKGGEAGHVDRGYGITRDVAAMAAYAQTHREKTYPGKAGSEVILMGTSLGGGPGTFAALTLNEQNLIALEGPPMPKGLKAVLQGPFFGPSDNFLNDSFGLLSKVPLVKDIPLPSLGLPILSTDPEAKQKIAQGAVLEDLRAQAQAMTATLPDMQAVLEKVEAGQGPSNPIQIVHSKGDPLANSALSQKLAQKLPNVKLTLLEGQNHVLEQSDAEQQVALDLLKKFN